MIIDCGAGKPDVEWELGFAVGWGRGALKP